MMLSSSGFVRTAWLGGKPVALKIAILADDLTGAIDTATPFALRGLKVAIALTADHLEPALLEDPAVLTVATGTRHMSHADAHARLLNITRLLRRFSPGIYFKKIDSRLKGNVVAETLAMLEALDRHQIVLAPAIPEQGRLLQSGQITGMGIERPISLPRFPTGINVHAPDIADPSDLARIASLVLDNSESLLAVGARGLGQALAAKLSVEEDASLSQAFDFPMLIAIGSRDPITARQVDHLVANRDQLLVENAPNGDVPVLPTLHSTLTLVRCRETAAPEDSDAVARRFGDGIAALIRRHMPRTVIASGGDTASAILLSAGVDNIQPIGEISCGLPISSFTLNGRHIHLITKSGGFGDEHCLSQIVRSARHAG
jgi:uncharacterized protein YgbK (DUF1537 family)